MKKLKTGKIPRTSRKLKKKLWNKVAVIPKHIRGLLNGFQEPSKENSKNWKFMGTRLFIRGIGDGSEFQLYLGVYRLFCGKNIFLKQCVVIYKSFSVGYTFKFHSVSSWCVR